MRIIVVPDTQEEIKAYINDINNELHGKQLKLSDKEFAIFWNSNIVDEFYKKSDKLIDDFETTIIMDENDVFILKSVIENSSFKVFDSDLKRKLLILADYAIEKKSGIVFLF